MVTQWQQQEYKENIETLLLKVLSQPMLPLL